MKVLLYPLAWDLARGIEERRERINQAAEEIVQNKAVLTSALQSAVKKGATLYNEIQKLKEKDTTALLFSDSSRDETRSVEDWISLLEKK